MTTEPRRINNSEIQAFKRCRRKWYLGYVKNLTATEESSPLFVGTLVHAGLETHYNGGDILAPIVQAEHDLSQNQVNALTGQPAIIISMDRWKDVALARVMLEGYKEWLAATGEDAGLSILSTEQTIELDMGIVRGRRVTLYGTLDMRYRTPLGEHFIVDHKTAASFATYTDRTLPLNEQLLTYCLLASQGLGEKVDGAVINALKKSQRTSRAKPPFYLRETVRFNPQNLEAHKKNLYGVITEMLKLEEELADNPTVTNGLLYPTVDADCTWKCPFLSVCPMVDDGSDIEGALEGLYQLKSA